MCIGNASLPALKTWANNEGVLGDEKSAAITQMVKTKRSKAYCQCGFDSPPVARLLVPVCIITRIGNSALSNTMSRWCNGSTWVSKTLGRSSSLWRDAKIWAGSDNGSTVALQASGRGSIPLRSTKLIRHR